MDERALIDGRYRVVQSIDGSNDAAALLMATDMETGALCALRFMPDVQKADELRQEGERLKALEHANIIPPGEVRGDPESPYLVRDFIDGRSLEELLKSAVAPLPLARACAIAKQIAMALEAAHHAGIIHGNLTPSQILITEQDGEEKAGVMGFELLPLFKDRFVSLAGLALEDGGGSLQGAPEYVSPEQALGTSADALDGRTDLYALGVILYRMLRGEVPFAGPPMEVLLAHVFNEPKPLSSEAPLEVPLALETLVLRMLAKKRSDRPAAATAVVDQLSPWEERREPEISPKPPELPVAMAPPAAKTVPPESPVPEPLPTAEVGATETASPVFAASQEQSAPVFSFASPALGSDSPCWETPSAQTSVFMPPAVAEHPLDAGLSSTPVDHAAVAGSNAAGQEPLPLLQTPPPETHSFHDLADAAYEPEPARSQHAFVPDLIPAPENGGPSPAETTEVELGRPASPMDFPLESPAPPEPAPHNLGGNFTPAAAVSRRTAASSLAPQARSRTWLKTLATAAIIVVVLIAAGCGLLYLTGRSYWFNPQFLKAKASYYLASGSSAAPQTETVDQPSNQTPPKPINTPQTTQSTPPETTAATPESTPEQHSASNTAASQSAAGKARLTPTQATPAASGATASAAPPSRQGAQAAAPSAAESAAVEDAITRGEYYFDRGDYDAAIQVYQETLDQYPSNSRLTAEVARSRRAKAAESKYLK